jgi:queuine tRNA-ribosyltransferase
MSRLNFRVCATSQGTQARCGQLTTLHGEVNTPVFMPVGTQATVKAQTRETLKEASSQILLANTYHLLLRPGMEVFKKMGGIHRFMRWDGPVLTDSGGFQIFSLPHSRRMTEKGAFFKSYVDGKTFLLTPELSIEMQKAIGSDIMMVLDQCVPSTSELQVAKDAMDKTHRWALRSLQARGDSPQSMFAIVQGACIEELRKQSAEYLTQFPFDGFAIGGLAVGESKSMREDFTELTTRLLPQSLPRYLMGVGTPIDLLEAVHRGVDMFDCILPTALSQRGVAFTSQGKLQLRRSYYKFSDEALDPLCKCRTCQNYSKAYIHHLIKAEEVLGWHLLGLHNLHFYQELMSEIRKSIFEDRFLQYYRAMREILQRRDTESPRGEYELFSSLKGQVSVKHTPSGEVMHSVNVPIEEAKALYIDQSHLDSKLRNVEDAPLVIWDVGLGAGTNAMAAIQCFEKVLLDLGNVRALRLISFEKDLDSFKLAIQSLPHFEYLKHEAPQVLLKEGLWESDDGLLKWQLIQGDFQETFSQAQLPDLVYYDPFSYKTNHELWSLECFSRLLSYFGDQKVELFTYSASTAVRATLLAVGFYVARGRSSGPKSETTVALTTQAFRERQGDRAQENLPQFDLLGKDWIVRLSRSTIRVTPEVSECVVAHPQFHHS